MNEDEKMNREEIVERYIEHVRNISELTDGEIESVINEAIEEDEELLDVLEKFLVKRENIREKLVTLDVEIKNEEKSEKSESEKSESEKSESEENQDEKDDGDNGDDNQGDIDDIVEVFDDIDDALLLEDITRELKYLGYVNPGSVIVDAIHEDLLYVDDIDDDGNIYFALTESGEELWTSRNA